MPTPAAAPPPPALAARFRRDARGTIAVSFSLALLPMMLVAGVAIDMGRVTKVRAEVQNAIDGAVVAAAKLDLRDEERADVAAAYFKGVIGPALAEQLSSATFELDEKRGAVGGTVALAMPTVFAGILQLPTMAYGARASAAIARPEVKALDLVMCIDATGSMQGTLDAVKANASSFDKALNAEMAERKIAPFDLMRVRVIYYRDFGGNGKVDKPEYIVKYTYKNDRRQVYYLPSDPYDSDYYRSYFSSYYDIERIKRSTAMENNEYANYYGDVPALKGTGMMTLPADAYDFRKFVNAETASGGGDLPESGLECFSAAMDSPWLRKGEQPRGVDKPLEAVYPIIVTWTDAAAHNPSNPASLANPTYPEAMPRDYDALAKKWASPATIDQANKLLVFFGDPNVAGASAAGVSSTTKSSGRGYPADGWRKVSAWPGYYQGGTLTQGNTQMVKRIADAVASKVRTPALTH